MYTIKDISWWIYVFRNRSIFFAATGQLCDVFCESKMWTLLDLIVAALYAIVLHWNAILGVYSVTLAMLTWRCPMWVTHLWYDCQSLTPAKTIYFVTHSTHFIIGRAHTPNNPWTTQDALIMKLLHVGGVLLKLKHGDVTERKRFPVYWPFVRGFHRSPMLLNK